MNMKKTILFLFACSLLLSSCVQESHSGEKEGSVSSTEETFVIRKYELQEDDGLSLEAETDIVLKGSVIKPSETNEDSETRGEEFLAQYMEFPETAGRKGSFAVLTGDEIQIYEDGVLQNQCVLTHQTGERLFELRDAYLISGKNRQALEEGRMEPSISLFDKHGKELWSRSFDEEGEQEEVCGVLEKEERSLLLFLRKQMDTLITLSLDKDGEVTDKQEIRLGVFGMNDAAQEDGTVCLALFNNADGVSFRLATTENMQDVKDVIDLVYKEREFHVEDLLVSNGHLYVSAYSVNTEEMNNRISSKMEAGEEISNEEMRSIMMENAESWLFDFDADNLTPLTFVHENGSFGSKLHMGDDGLIWDNQEILSSMHFPFSSAFQVLNTCEIREYHFDVELKLLNKAETEEMRVVFI